MNMPHTDLRFLLYDDVTHFQVQLILIQAMKRPTSPTIVQIVIDWLNKLLQEVLDVCPTFGFKTLKHLKLTIVSLNRRLNYTYCLQEIQKFKS